jgi:hypothetical protein
MHKKISHPPLLKYLMSVPKVWHETLRNGPRAGLRQNGLELLFSKGFRENFVGNSFPEELKRLQNMI